MRRSSYVLSGLLISYVGFLVPKWYRSDPLACHGG